MTLFVFAKLPNDKAAPLQQELNLLNVRFVVAGVGVCGGSPSRCVCKQGEFDDFEPKWFASVGSTVLTAMAIQVVAPHIAPLLQRFVLVPLKRRFGKKKQVTQVGKGSRGCFVDTIRHSLVRSCATQNKLNLLFEGPEFNIAQRMPRILNAMLVTMFYAYVALRTCGVCRAVLRLTPRSPLRPFSFSAGMPLLLPIAALNFFITFWVDKAHCTILGATLSTHTQKALTCVFGFCALCRSYWQC